MAYIPYKSHTFTHKTSANIELIKHNATVVANLVGSEGLTRNGSSGNLQAMAQVRALRAEPVHPAPAQHPRL